jgi:ABC-type branched-subunit amino acid transport system ATPase component
MLEVLSLSKSFGGLAAVDQASLDVATDEIVALIGPNGAGKTTLFACIAGFIRPDGGSVRFLGRDVTGWRPHHICAQGIARTFQVTQPFARLSVLENVMVGAYHTTGRRREAAARAEDVARRLGLGRQLDVRADALTLAGCKRLELARALATRPRLLLLDEVMAGLNPVEVEEIVRMVRAIHATGVAILLIEHVMQAVVSLAGRVYVLNNGRIIASGSPAATAADPGVIEAYLGHGAAARPQHGAAHA